MKHGTKTVSSVMTACSVILVYGAGTSVGSATEPCEDFGECKVLVEINATDGDIGFHWLIDGDDLNSVRMDDPNGKKVYENKAFGPLRDQKLTETFGESAEPVCKESLTEEEDDVVVTLEEFADRWAAGTYEISGKADGGEKLEGETDLTYYLPAAPADVLYSAGVISWMPGTDLGECATNAELVQLVADGVLPVHPMDVPVAVWEVVLELEDGSNRSFKVQLPAFQTSVTVSSEFLTSVDPNTPAKAEVGAIGGFLDEGDDDNATFTEVGDICLNEIGDGCEEE